MKTERVFFEMKEAIKNELVKMFGEEFYDDIGQLKTADDEAQYIIDNIAYGHIEQDGEKLDGESVQYFVKNWTDGYLTIDEYNAIDED